MLFFLLLLFPSCFQKVGEPLTLVEKGKKYLSTSQYQEALSVFQQLEAENPKSCDAAYGILLAQAGLGLNTLNSLFSVIFSALGSLGGSDETTLPSLFPVYPLQPLQNTSTSDTINSIIEQFFIPFLSQFQQVETAVQRIEQTGCTFWLDHYVVDLRLGDIIWVYMDLRGEWSVVEAKIIGAIFDLITAVDYLVLSLDLNVNLDPIFTALLRIFVNCTQQDDVMQCVNNFSDNTIPYPVADKLLAITRGDLVTTLRALGFIFARSPNFLAWHPSRYGYFLEVGTEFASSLTRIADAFNILMNRKTDVPGYDLHDDPTDDVIVFKDSATIGAYDPDDDIYMNAYNPLKPELEMKEDNICYNIFIGVSPINDDPNAMEWCKNTFFDVFKSIIISDAFAKLLDFMYDWANIFSGKDQEGLIRPGELRDVLLGSLVPIPDVFSFKPQAWFSKTPDEFLRTVSPPREWLPFYRDMDGDEYEDFVVEGETYSSSSTYPCSATYIKYGDCPHFPTSFTWFKSATPLNLQIPPDCEGPTENVFLLYMAPQDPSLGGALYVNLDSSEFPVCSNSIEDAVRNTGAPYVLLTPDTQGRYLFNKALNIIFKQFSGLISSGGASSP